MDVYVTRKATKADLPAIHALVGELAEYEKEPEAFTASLEDYTKDFEAGIFQAIVAEKDKLVIGMALYFMTYSTWKGRMMYLDDFVVTAPERRKGVGQLLFDAFIEDAKSQRCRLVKWEVLDWNEPALEFYRKNKAIIETNWWDGKIFLD